MPTQAQNQQKEIDRWRNEAVQNLRKAARLMEAILQAASALVALSDLHQPDDFNHCAVCEKPYPCKTARIIRELSELFNHAQEENGDKKK